MRTHTRGLAVLTLAAAAALTGCSAEPTIEAEAAPTTTADDATFAGVTVGRPLGSFETRGSWLRARAVGGAVAGRAVVVGGRGPVRRSIA
jgi:hypothetical protein